MNGKWCNQQWHISQERSYALCVWPFIAEHSFNVLADMGFCKSGLFLLFWRACALKMWRHYRFGWCVFFCFFFCLVLFFLFSFFFFFCMFVFANVASWVTSLVDLAGVCLYKCGISWITSFILSADVWFYKCGISWITSFTFRLTCAFTNVAFLE